MAQYIPLRITLTKFPQDTNTQRKYTLTNIWYNVNIAIISIGNMKNMYALQLSKYNVWDTVLNDKYLYTHVC